jgi:hypothetical protein
MNTTRSVRRLVQAHRQLEGAGFVVRRPVPTVGLEQVDPFLMLDEMGPIAFGPNEALGAPDHPHRGFETVTDRGMRTLHAGVLRSASQGHAVAVGGRARHHGSPRSPASGSMAWPSRGVTTLAPVFSASTTSVSGGSLHAWRPSSKVAQ